VSDTDTVETETETKQSRTYDLDNLTVRSVGLGKREPSHIDGTNIGNPADNNNNLRSAAVSNIEYQYISSSGPLSSSAGPALRDPYTFSMKIRFEEAYRCDPVVRAAINKKTAFVLGKSLSTTFDLVDTFVKPEEARAAMNIVLSDREIADAKRVVDRVDRKCNFQQNLKAAFIQAKVFGRSAILVEGPENGLPVNMKILSSKLLGQVVIDPYTWRLERVQYNAPGVYGSGNYLQGSDIVYFTNCDYHVSPYTIGYGLSDLEAIAHISETNRILNEEDLKEINYSMWSGFGLLKVPTIRNAAEIQSFLSSFKPGRWCAISQDITAEVHELQKDLASLLTERNENEKLILRDLAVPAAILGFEDIQNFATLQEVMLAWKESEIEEQRTWINSIVEPQWFDRLLVQILGVDDPDDLKVKIILAFEDIALENLKDKALAVIPLYEAGILPPDRVLEYLGFDDVADQVRLLQTKSDTAMNQLQTVALEQQAKLNPRTPKAVDFPQQSSAQGLNQELQQNLNVQESPIDIGQKGQRPVPGAPKTGKRERIGALNLLASIPS